SRSVMMLMRSTTPYGANSARTSCSVAVNARFPTKIFTGCPFLANAILGSPKPGHNNPPGDTPHTPVPGTGRNRYSSRNVRPTRGESCALWRAPPAARRVQHPTQQAWGLPLSVNHNGQRKTAEAYDGFPTPVLMYRYSVAREIVSLRHMPAYVRF